MRTVPSVGSSSPAMVRTAVDLPLPLAPIRATHSPAATLRSSPASATRRPYVRRRALVSSGASPPIAGTVADPPATGSRAAPRRALPPSVHAERHGGGGEEPAHEQ